MRNQRTLLSSVAVVALLATPVVVSVPTDGWAQIDELIVSTRRREENIQRVPIAVTAFTLGDIERKGINDLQDLTKLTSGVILDQGFAPQDTRVVIRGLSPERGRPNAAFLVDGIDVTSEAVGTAGGSLLLNTRLLDIERIEVVKGPQSALYGRSAFAGAINYITRKPGDEFEGRAGFDIGQDGQASVKGSLSGPVIEDTLSVGVLASYWTHDGFHDNTITGERVGDKEGYGLAASGVFTPTENLEIVGRLEYSDQEFGPRAVARVPFNAFLLAPTASLGPVFPPIPGIGVSQVTGKVPDADDLAITLSPDPRTGEDYEGTTQEVFRASLIAYLDTDIGRFASYTGFADAENTQFQDLDRRAIGNPDTLNRAQELNFATETRLITQEFRFASDWDFPVQLTVGGLYWDEEVEQKDNSLIAFQSPFGPPGPSIPANPFLALATPFERMAFRNTQHGSAYALAEWRINEQWKLSAEVRYVDETSDVGVSDGSSLFFYPTFPGAPLGPAPANTISGSVSDSYFAPKGTIEWDPTEDILIYASIAQGIKPGGISTVTGGGGGFDSLDQFTFDAEKVLVYEIGAKTEWLENTLQVNGAFFYQDFSDKQVSTQVATTDGMGGASLGTAIENASSATVWGFELDALWVPTDNWRFTASYTYLDTEYDDFRITSSGLGNVTAAGNCTVVVIAGTPTCEIDLSGNDLEDAPKHAFSGSATYIQPLWDEISGFVGVDFQYQGERFEDEFNLLAVQSYFQLDANIGVEHENWDLMVYVDNVLDDDTVRSVQSGPDITNLVFGPVFTLPTTQFAFIPDPRTVGVRANVRF